MLLRDETFSLRLTVSGYEFPHATEPERRFSRHMVDGEALTPDGAWRFRYPALNCDETPMVAMWLTTVADWAEESGTDFVPPVLQFTQANISFRVDGDAGPDGVGIAVDLDREFRPPWRRSPGSAPYRLTFAQDIRALRHAAAAWAAEIAPYPDGLEQLADGAEAD